MGVMIEGVWHAEEPASGSADDGKYRRSVSAFRNWVTPDGAPGGEGCVGGFAAEAGRYHLYVALNCPWAHRTMIVRVLKGLEDVVSLDAVLPRRSAEGWIFAAPPEANSDSLLGSHALHKIYAAADTAFSGRVTVPVLWDKKRRTIVSNESSEIIRMLNSAFDDVGANGADLYPTELRGDIDRVNERVYRSVNNGVYRAGFARSQEAYEEAFDELFEALDMLEARLATRRYLCGDMPSEADWRLFPTLMRFDVAYFGAFKCNLRRIQDYPNLWGYVRELYQMQGIAATCDLDVYKQGYYSISELRNPLGIVPKGPAVDFSTPHGRRNVNDRIGQSAAVS
ncbi:MAG: glutathione S-transferase family protein [Rhodospirillaceae bacterium]|nr:glutathione S-transferase family protein [Rhodospirillaceae bacterium]